MQILHVLTYPDIDRGEGVNHGVLDGCFLADKIKRSIDGECSLQEAVFEYEEEMKPRARTGVEQSRQAGFDAHDYQRVATEGSVALLGEKTV